VQLSSVARRGAGLLVALTLALGAGQVTAHADSAADDPSSAVAAAKQQLAQAQAQASALRSQASADAAQLAVMQQRMNALLQKIAALDAEVVKDKATVVSLKKQIAADRASLGSFLRASYESGDNAAMIEYVFSASDISSVIQRTTEIGHIADAGQILVDRIDSEEQQADQALKRATKAQGDAHAARLQLQTETVIMADQTAQAQLDAAGAETTVAQVQGQLRDAVHAAQVFDEAASAMASARSEGTIFSPVAGPVFTEDSDLTVPSQLDAATIDSFLAGTPLEGLGSAYIQAEQTWHVSARYLVAHSIEESDWGRSAIAQDKHNLYGYGADDANPYGDAMSFKSFADCIMFVAHKVAQNYLTPPGSFYHGPTLRGMNVCYASDPYWAVKIANIARTIPTPDGATQSGGGTWATPTPGPSPSPGSS
jgi:beta-N-acetylglucosaminidase